MQDIVQAIAGKLGIGESTVGSAVTVILQLVQEHADSGPAAALIAKLPGAQALLDSAGAPAEASDGGQGGGLGGLMGSVAGALGGQMGGLGALAQLQDAGLDSDQVGPLVGQFLDFAKEHAGDDLVNQVSGSIPGLQDLVG